MTSQQTNGQQATGTNGTSGSNVTNGTVDLGKYIPKGASGIGVHDMVPELGYREYWYPAVEQKLIRRQPVALTLLVPPERKAPR